MCVYQHLVAVKGMQYVFFGGQVRFMNTDEIGEVIARIIRYLLGRRENINFSFCADVRPNLIKELKYRIVGDNIAVYHRLCQSTITL